MKKLDYKILNLLTVILLVAGNIFAQRTTQNPISVMTTQVNEVPNPQLRWVKTDTNAKGNDGKPYVAITLNIPNYNQYEKRFVAAPDLAPCGENKNASRTWVHIINAETGKAVYGYCAFNKHYDARSFTFLVERENLPGGVFVVLEDRAERKNYQSNCINPLNGKECTIAPTVKLTNISLWKVGTKINPGAFKIAKPDLRIDYFYFSSDNNKITVRVRNACKTAVNASFPVTVIVHEGKTLNTKAVFNETKKIDSLAAGIAKEVTFDFSSFANGKDIRGKNLIEIAIDTGNYVEEVSENNNGFGISSANQSIFPEAPCEQ